MKEIACPQNQKGQKRKWEMVEPPLDSNSDFVSGKNY